MSKPSPGTYKIINRVLSVTNKPLAITANAEGKATNVTEEASPNTAQNAPSGRALHNGRFAVGYSDTQSIVPVARPALQAAWGSGVVTVRPAHGYVWTIRETDTGVTIQDGGRTAFWGVANANEDSQVTIGPGTGDVQ